MAGFRPISTTLPGRAPSFTAAPSHNDFLTALLQKKSLETGDVRHPLQVAGKLAQAAAAAFRENKATKKVDARQQALADTLRGAVNAKGVKAFNNPGPEDVNGIPAGGELVPARSQRQAVVDALMGNVDTVEAGFNLATQPAPERFEDVDLPGGGIGSRSTTTNRLTSVVSGAKGPTVRDQRVAELKARGFSDADAADIASGQMTVSGPDAFGNFSVVNRTTGESRPVTLNGAAATTTAQAAQATPGRPITDKRRGELADKNAELDVIIGLIDENLLDAANKGAGPVASVVAGLDRVFGWMKDGQIGPETQLARQGLRQFAQLAKAALVNNPKFPVAEQAIVARLLPNTDEFFSNPDTMRANLIELRSLLQRLQSGGEAAMEQRSIPEAMRTSADAVAPTATGPNGEKLILRDGKWEPF